MPSIVSAKNMMLCWNPGTDQVALIPWPDPERLSSKFDRSSLACYSEFQAMTLNKRKGAIMAEAMALIIRDKCNPMAVHKVLLGLSEYRDSIPEDMPYLHESTT